MSEPEPREEETSEDAGGGKTEVARPEWPEGVETLEGRAIIRLVEPIKVGGEEVSVLRLKQPRMHEISAQDGQVGEIAKAMAILAACAGIPVPSVRQMSPTDYAQCEEALAPFVQPIMG